MHVFNTLTRKKEEFIPLPDRAVSLYSCGPTVYNYVHIGNLRAFVFYDVLKRHLASQGYAVKHVMNITDIDDKTIKGAQREGKTLEEFTRFYEEKFFEDLATLRIRKDDFFANPRATETIKEMVLLIQHLIDRGYAYKASDGSLYYDISEFEDYGQLAQLDIGKLKAGASGRVAADEYDKEHVQDFALWKAYTEEDGDVSWPKEPDLSWWPVGFPKGRPGWHIECSAMSMKLLGEQIDIHTGGIDLVFPHHQNEIAQSEARTHKQFAKYWMHCEHLLVDNRKMSKSLGNFYTLRDVLAKGYKPEAIRYLLLSAHYRSKLNFTFEGLKAAQNTVASFNEFIQKARHYNAPESAEETVDSSTFAALKEFEEAMDDDLQTPRAIQAIFEFMAYINKKIDQKKIAQSEVAKILGVMQKADTVLDVMTFEKERLPEELSKLIGERERARLNKEWKKADELRDLLRKKGIEVQDTPSGPVWKRT